MFQKVAFYLSLAVFTLGMAYRVASWLRHSIVEDVQRVHTSQRAAAALKGILLTLFSRKAFRLIEVFCMDVVFQRKLMRQDAFRWLTHMCIYGGFTMLLLMHGMDKLITSVLFPAYYPTLNPFLFLRDVFAALVIVGLMLSVYRRFLRKGQRPATNAMDLYAMAILAVIMGTGVLLEGTKIASHSLYQEMVDEYAGPQDQQTLSDLEAYWVQEYAVASPNATGPFTSKTLERGKAFHETSCGQCHSSPKWAFMGYSAAKAMRPIAIPADRADLRAILLTIHFLSCFLGLAYLPFSKMFHIFASPMSMLMNAVMEAGTSDPANMATKQMIELDACTHCGACTWRCAVAVAFHEIPNVNILPSEKLASIKALAAKKSLSDKELGIIQQGMHLCTNCYRCTSICPVGIDLQNLWISTREALLKKSLPEFVLLSPLSIYAKLLHKSNGGIDVGKTADWARQVIATESDSHRFHDMLLPIEPGKNVFMGKLNGTVQTNSFSKCYGCMICSTACPVVRNYSNPTEVLGLMPHQLMHATGLRLWDLIFGSKMLWDCLGCYQCQEHCPMGVCVTDIIYELKTLAIAHATRRPH